MRGLFEGLDYAQSAPLGFLLVQKGVVAMLGTSEYALRGFPFVCGILALFLFWRVATLVLSGWAVTFAVGLFSLGLPFVQFSSLVKQYSSDVAVATVLLLMAVEIRRRGVTTRRAWLLGLIGAAAVWFSQPALFVLAGIAASFVILVWTARDRAAARTLTVTGVLWGVSAAAAAMFALRTVTAEDQAFFQWIWADGFMPIDGPWGLAWVFLKLTWAFGSFGSGMGQMHGGLTYRWSPVFMLVMLAGLWALWKTRRDVALFLILPIAITAVASALKVYPFTARLFAFLLPGLLLATAAGAKHLLSVCPRPMSFLVPAVIAVLGGAPIYAAATTLPPFWLQHVRPVIERVNAQRGADDGVYVYYGGAQAFHYYSKRYRLSMEDLVIGRCHAGNPRQYLRELDHFRGKDRLWVIVTASWRNGTEVELMLAYLDRLGRRLETIAIPGYGEYVGEAAAAYLYDLSDPKRLESVSSSTFLVEGPVADPAGQWACYGVFQPDPVTR